LLRKSIYGTKQGGNRWNKKMHAVLKSLGFTQSYSDASIDVYVKGDTRVILPVFVDDMTFASKSAAAIDQIILELSQQLSTRSIFVNFSDMSLKSLKCVLKVTEVCP
jgi:glyceraldehyde-3-phosphate dehydrogenase/erythrose-4-phosphate dehydrogenase